MKKIKLILVGNDVLGLGGDGQKQESKTPPVVTPKEEPKHDDDEDDDDSVTISKSLFERLVNKIGDASNASSAEISNKELIQSIKEMTATMSRTSGVRIIGATPIDAKDIDPDDVLTFPAVFFAHSIKYSIYDDIRGGRVVTPPYGGAFRFKKIERSVDASNARRPSYVSVSACLVYSKKEREWLVNHSHFGIKFFENTAQSRAITNEKQEALAHAMAAVSRYDDHQIISSCINEKVAVDTSDVSILRRRLIEKRAESFEKSLATIRKKPLEDIETYNDIKKDMSANQKY